MLLSDYLKIGHKLEAEGVFDPVLDEDSHFFINIQRLKKTVVPEFTRSYEKIREYFRRIIKLLDKAEKKDKSDIFYKRALELFDFSEVNGICLGYAKGTSGAGFGAGLGNQVISTAFDIVKAGVMDPEFFELLPLFQENVGADRLSDMIATLILDDIKEYTKRINQELGINQKRYNKLIFNGEFLINPYKHDEVFLVPIDILHELPVAESWENVEYVVIQNSILRAVMNAEVASEWQKYTTTQRKDYLKRDVFKNPDTCMRVIEGYRKEELDVFDPYKDFQYFLTKLCQMFENLGFNWKTEKKAVDSYIAAHDILSFFKQWVEHNKGWEVIQNADSRNREKIVQRVMHYGALSYIKANYLDMSCEPNEGSGPVDFKVSNGGDKTIIEVKLSSSNQYLHGYEVQIDAYGRAESTDKLIYVLIDLGNPGKIKKVQDLHDKRYNEGQNPPDLIIIDSTPKESASRA